MRDMQQKGIFQDPKVVLQTAIEELDVFTQSDASRLEVGEDGRLVAAKESRLERVISLARSYIGPLFLINYDKSKRKGFLKLRKPFLQRGISFKVIQLLLKGSKKGMRLNVS